MTSVFSFSQNLSEFRALIQKGESSETVAKSLLENLKQSMIQTKLPIYEALYAVGHFFMAKHGVILYPNTAISIKVKNCCLKR
jgi:hypothetical protein